MARSDDFPRTARDKLEREIVRQADKQRGGASRSKKSAETSPPEELVANARMRDREIELTAELELAREEEAEFESRHGMTFEEFQATFDPRTNEDLGEDYLAWSRAAERVRMLRYEVSRLTGRRTRRAKEPPPDTDQNQKPDRGRMS
jgi:hypothetical protein